MRNNYTTKVTIYSVSFVKLTAILSYAGESDEFSNGWVLHLRQRRQYGGCTQYRWD